jgi:adenine-specific DNA-methyltransferase
MQLQDLLRDLFQLDLADLDFGLYRLLHIKRDEVEAFITQQLPRHVDEAFESLADEERVSIEREVAELAGRVRSVIDEQAILTNGEINPQFASQTARAAREALEAYMAKRKQLDSVLVADSQKAEVFNQLHAFLSRYYEAGDFMPRRHRVTREHYSVPYNGEETLFHWTNKGQHYVKTGEAFRDYAFTVDLLGGPWRVRFVLAEASVPPGNTKGDMRYFFPLPDQVTWDAGGRTFTLPFQYRLPSQSELANQTAAKLQEVLLRATEPRILESLPDDALAAALSAVLNDNEQETTSLLLKRMRHFARRNTSDYFIHKNLQRFLLDELDFYLKDQVLHVADIEGDLQRKLRTVRVIRQLAADVIGFLAQIEEVQKRLFEKRKLVLRTDYLLPIKEVPKDLWPRVLANTAQLEAWRTLFAIEPPDSDVGFDESFLDDQPTLVVNTAHFEVDFKEHMLRGFEDLDAVTDGLLIHSENYQALRLLERKYVGKIKCIYIDPPYNTGSDEFIYKDRYRHSSWLSMMEERLRLARNVLSFDGSIFVSIDDHEQSSVRKLLDEIFGSENFVATLIWQKVYSPKSTAKHFSDDHDYIVVYVCNAFKWTVTLLPRTAAMEGRYINLDNDPRGPWKPSGLDARNFYSRGIYPVTSPSGRVISGPPAGSYWRVSPEKFRDLDSDGRIWWGKDGNNIPAIKRFATEVRKGRVPQTLWGYKEAGHTQEAKKELLSMVRFVRTEDVLNTVKPTRLIRRILQIASQATGSERVLDFFAGSGTTGDAVIRQNREDGAGRKFVLVEMGKYFEELVLQRIQRAIYAPEWKDGNPKRRATQVEVERTPRLVKVLRLESYEDALHNLATEGTLEREAPRARAHKATLGEVSYRLSYLARLPLESSSSMLDLAALEHPFSYTIEVLTENGPQTQTVDLVETFNLLYGLHVERLENWINNHDQRRYRVVKGKNRAGRRVLVLWRDMAGLDPAVERRFLEDQLTREDPFDEKLVNGDSATLGFSSLDGLFKGLLDEAER